MWIFVPCIILERRHELNCGLLVEYIIQGVFALVSHSGRFVHGGILTKITGSIGSLYTDTERYVNYAWDMFIFIPVSSAVRRTVFLHQFFSTLGWVKHWYSLWELFSFQEIFYKVIISKMLISSSEIWTFCIKKNVNHLKSLSLINILKFIMKLKWLTVII